MMIPKGEGCRGCPFEYCGNYMVPDLINPDSTIKFMAQNPGKDEIEGRLLVKTDWSGGVPNHEYAEVTPQPLIGATGQMFNSRFLKLAGLQRDQISIGNAIRCRPGLPLKLKKADSLPNITNKMDYLTSKAPIVQAMRHCDHAYGIIPPKTKLIVTMGSYSLMQQTGQTDSTNWRGYVLPKEYTSHDTYYDCHADLPWSDIRVFSTLHIAALNYGTNKKFYHAVLQDFAKIQRLLKGQWPLPLPEWSDTPPVQWPSYASFDTEYTINKPHQLIRYSLCDTKNNLYVVEAPNVTKVSIQPGSTVLMQNALADIGFLEQIVDITKVIIEDLMLAHSVIATGEPHSLNYISSIFGAFNRHKHLIHDQPELYSALDAYDPMHIWRYGFMPIFRKDKAAWRVYQEYVLPLIPIINKSQKTGMALDQERLALVKEIYQGRVDWLQQQARELTGDPSFNLGGSKKLATAIYGEADPDDFEEEE